MQSKSMELLVQPEVKFRYVELMLCRIFFAQQPSLSMGIRYRARPFELGCETWHCRTVDTRQGIDFDVAATLSQRKPPRMLKTLLQ